MNYIPEESKVIYQAKDGRQEKVFDAPEWLAAMCSHVPIKGESRRAGSVTMVITVSILMLDSCLESQPEQHIPPMLDYVQIEHPDHHIIGCD
jgi:hypothetical protein